MLRLPMKSLDIEKPVRCCQSFRIWLISGFRNERYTFSKAVVLPLWVVLVLEGGWSCFDRKSHLFLSSIGLFLHTWISEDKVPFPSYVRSSRMKPFCLSLWLLCHGSFLKRRHLHLCNVSRIVQILHLGENYYSLSLGGWMSLTIVFKGEYCCRLGFSGSSFWDGDECTGSVPWRAIGSNLCRRIDPAVLGRGEVDLPLKSIQACPSHPILR